MRLLKTFPAVALASSLLVGGFGLPQTSNAQQISLSFGDSDRYDRYDDYDNYGSSNFAGDVLGAFLTGIVNHFGSNERDIYLLQDRGIRERELPVVFHLARQAGVSPMMVADLRASGYSWSDITYHLGLTGETFYVPVSGNYYGQYSSYYQMPRSRWSTLRLSDDAVIGLVNTRFLSDYYRAPVHEVFRYRSSGRDFPTLARQYYRPERHGQIRVWNRHKGNSSVTTHTTTQQREVIQEPMQPRVNEREERRQERIRMERQERNREAALRRDARQSREVQVQERPMMDRQERNREAALRRDARQQGQVQDQRMTERQERNREAALRRDARKSREEQAQEQRQEQRQERRQAKRNKKDKD